MTAILNAQEEQPIDTSSQTPVESNQDNSISYFKISGDAGAYGELYTISGKERRRPPASGRIFFRPTVTILEHFSITFDFLLSTEGSAARQQINQFAIHPTWGWGRAHIGDFSHEFSRFTLSGINIRGAGIELYPGIFRFQAIGGQTQRAVKADPYSSTYSRYLGGMKIGVGREESAFFDIIFVKSKDNSASLNREVFMETKPLPADSTIVDTSYIGTSPQENMIIGVNTSVKLLDNMIRFKGEVAGSAYTRDLYSEEATSANIPDFVSKIYKPRISFNADYAYSTELAFSYDLLDAQAGYTYVGPGYTSLGLSSLSNDKKILDGKLGLRFFENSLMFRVYIKRKRTIYYPKSNILPL